MKSISKKMAITLIALVSMSMAVSAQQQGDVAIGANLVFGSGNSYSNVGIGGKFQYNVTNPIRVEGAVTYFLEKNSTTMLDISANAHYLFTINDQFNVYPLVGLSILNSNTKGGGGSNTDYGLNLGAGVDYKLTEKLFLTGELKFRISDHNRTLVSVGIAYRF